MLEKILAHETHGMEFRWQFRMNKIIVVHKMEDTSLEICSKTKFQMAELSELKMAKIQAPTLKYGSTSTFNAVSVPIYIYIGTSTYITYSALYMHLDYNAF